MDMGDEWCVVDSDLKQRSHICVERIDGAGSSKGAAVN